jgi:uncharacterized membrane protein SpoIIM required for sporulation
MKETDFIGQNKQKWDEFEKVLKSKNQDPEELGKLFIETTDDLSFSRTLYPNRSVRVYLNGLAQKVYHQIYKNRRQARGSFSRFWIEDLPDAMYHARPQLLLSFIIFAVGVGIGILSGYFHPDFAEIILSERYVEITEQNITNNDPMAIYKSGGMLESFLRITWNNIQVGMLCFLLGMLFEIGTIFIVLSNAIMVGAFMQFFMTRNLFEESFYAVMLHGTMELSMIVLAGAAGLTLGRGLVFPGNHTRLQAFLVSARQGIRIMIGVSCFLVLAGFIEGFLTRFTDIPNIIRGSLILLSLVLVIGYFVYYPAKRAKLGLVQSDWKTENLNETAFELKTNSIKSNGELVYETWRVFISALSRNIMSAFLVAICFTCLLYYFLESDFLSLFDYGMFEWQFLFAQMFDALWFWDEANNFFEYRFHWSLFPLTVAAMTLVLYLGLNNSKRGINDIQGISHILNQFNSLLAALMLCGSLWMFHLTDNEVGNFIFDSASVVFCLFWWPFVLASLAISQCERQTLFVAMSRTLRLLKGVFGQLFKLFISLGLVAWVGLAVMGAPIFYLIFEILGTQFAASLPFAGELIYILFTVTMIFALAFFLPVFLMGFSLLYFSLLEISEANNLKKDISQIEFKTQAYGLEKEQ